MKLNCLAALLALLAFAALLLVPLATLHAADTTTDRVATVMNTPGYVAFWDFVKREPGGAHRFTAHVPKGATNDFALDAGNYIKDYWGEGREASYTLRGHRLRFLKSSENGRFPLIVSYLTTQVSRCQKRSL